MSEVSRAQQEEALAKKRLEEDAFIKAAPDALIKLRKHDCDELGPNAWFAKLKIDQLRANACEYYKVKVVKTLKAKVVAEMVQFYNVHPSQLPN